MPPLHTEARHFFFFFISEFLIIFEHLMNQPVDNAAANENLEASVDSVLQHRQNAVLLKTKII